MVSIAGDYLYVLSLPLEHKPGISNLHPKLADRDGIQIDQSMAHKEIMALNASTQKQYIQHTYHGVLGGT